MTNNLYNPLPWQIPAFKDKSPVLLLTGAAGGGKSKLAAEKVNAYCWKYPGSTWLILRKAKEWASKSIVAFMWESVMGRDGRIKFNASKGTFVYPNGSVIYSGGMLDDKQRESVRSIGGAGGLDGAWFEEANAFSRKDFEEILGRVRHTAASWQQIILTTNPDSPSHWINKDLIEGGNAAVYYSKADDNPNNSTGYQARLQKMTGVMRERLVLGKWVQAEGAVYDEYDNAIHLIDPFPIPADWRRIRSIDFGYTNPFVCQWWAIDPDGRMYLYKELYVTRRLVEDLAAEIIKLSGKDEFEATISDHDAEDRATLDRHGIYTVPATKNVLDGVNATKERMKVQEDKKPRIFIFRNSLVAQDPLLLDEGKPTSLVDELPGYSWPKSNDQRTVKDAPVKMNDHACDTMRYAVMYADSGPTWYFA